MTKPPRFTAKELRSCIIHDQDICPDSFDDSQLPTDIHLVRYRIGDVTFTDAVRSFSLTDAFDVYYDKLKGIGTVESIKSGYGRIKPKLYNTQKPKK